MRQPECSRPTEYMSGFTKIEWNVELSNLVYLLANGQLLVESIYTRTQTRSNHCDAVIFYVDTEVILRIDVDASYHSCIRA